MRVCTHVCVCWQSFGERLCVCVCVFGCEKAHAIEIWGQWDPIGDPIGDPICMENEYKINGNQWEIIDQWKSMELEIMDLMEIH